MAGLTEVEIKIILMELIKRCLILALVTQSKSRGVYDPANDENEDDFLAEFGLPKINNQEIKIQRNTALKEHEKLIKRQNEQYNNGMKSWWDKLNDFADLPDEQRDKEKTGAKVEIEREYNYRGLILDNITEDRSEAYFDMFRYSRSSHPSSYNAVKEAIVSPVQNQQICGSCVSFATIATVETCFKKITGVFGDYSEQELVDCAYGQGANGCRGAKFWSYAKWIVKNKRELMSEVDYPYLNTRPNLRCPREKPYRLGARVTDYSYTRHGDEETMKKLVYEHGAVVTGVCADSTFSYYGGGVLNGCMYSEVNHAVAVVGYGTDENGLPYWLIKNS